nr:hypothetical protein [uncultured Sphaerochaeta sp.]
MKDLIDLGDISFWPFNACVGTNGRVSDYNYFEGYSEATKRLCLAVLSDDRSLADTLIYPIVFNARHSLEIALKISLREVVRLDDTKLVKKAIFKGHNLINLFNMLKDHSRSIPEIRLDLEKFQKEIPNSIRKIIDIDDNGETFRYRTDIKGHNHLDNQLMHINIKIFYDEYLILYDMIKSFFNNFDYLNYLNSFNEDIESEFN